MKFKTKGRNSKLDQETQQIEDFNMLSVPGPSFMELTSYLHSAGGSFMELTSYPFPVQRFLYGTDKLSALG
ncbi:unnamed protein product [Camellia sinensis]